MNLKITHTIPKGDPIYEYYCYISGKNALRLYVILPHILRILYIGIGYIGIDNGDPLIVLAIIFLIAAFVCDVLFFRFTARIFGRIAEQKGYSNDDFTFLCAILTVTGWFMVAALPDRTAGTKKAAGVEMPGMDSHSAAGYSAPILPKL